jgi:hypothetical protein
MRMRIVQSFGPVGAGRRREIGRAAEGGGFAAGMNAGRTARPTSVTTLTPLATLGAMLAVQAAEDPLLGRRRARERGDRMLDVLEEVRSAMLDGRLSRGQLVGLQKLVAERRDPSDDAALEATIDEIEMRTAVELAKLERWKG